jgi:hypothetical protein
MSTKTLRKRIALVAVTALGAGLLSVVAVPSANATSDITDIRTGSVGLLAGTANASITGVTSTATILSTGSLVISADNGYFEVSAGAVIAGFVGTVNAVDIIDADQLGAILPAVSGTATGFIVKPTGAIGSTFTVTSYDEAGTTIAERITVTIAGASVAGALSVANSTVAFTATDGADATADVVDENKTTVGLPLFLNVQLKDAYLAPITSVTGALVVTVSAGAVVGLSVDNDTVDEGFTFTQAVSSASPADINIQVNEKTVGTGWSGTITVSYNGVVVASKTGTITGAPAKITLAAVKIGATGSNLAALEYQVTDTAGNIVVLTQTSLVFSSSSNAAVVSTGVGDGINSSTAAGTAAFTCVTGGTANLVLQTTLSDASIVKTNSVAVRCGGAAATYTASFDKAIYAQGEIAKLTVSFKDALGLAANSYSQVSANTTADQVVSVSQTERVTVHAVAAKLGAAGTLVYTFTVGTTAGAIPGKYQALVSFPTVATGETQTVAYEISGGAGVSLADVLKAIVSLIASINKQIAALQKALLKK